VKALSGLIGVTLLMMISVGYASGPISPSPYTLPWQLRSVMPATAIRLDSAIAFYDDNSGNSGGTVEATVLTGTYKFFSHLTGIIRLPMVIDDPPANGQSGVSFANPLIGATYSLTMPSDFRLAFSLGMTIPVGMGSGDSPDASVQSANAAAVLARSAMDNSLFAVNYLTVIPGVDIAYIGNRMTIQGEATLF